MFERDLELLVFQPLHGIVWAVDGDFSLMKLVMVRCTAYESFDDLAVH
jgi:hypothetical protein